MIFEAIAAIKVANDAIAVIREAASNLRSVKDVAGPLTKLVDAEEQIKEKAEKGDMDAFFALENLREERRRIREMMQWNGRAGLWDDFVRFEKTRRELKENERKRIAAKKARQRKMMIDITVGTLLGLSILTAVGLIGYIFYYISKAQ